MYTLLIVPAVTEQASRCRLVGSSLLWHDALQGYRAHRSMWRDVGFMNHEGRIVCIDPSVPQSIRTNLLEDQPLMAGMVYVEGA